jgi:hypothetical protein
LVLVDDEEDCDSIGEVVFCETLEEKDVEGVGEADDEEEEDDEDEDKGFGNSRGSDGGGLQ